MTNLPPSLDDPVLLRLALRIEAFDPRSATREQWAAYHAFRRVLASERDPTVPAKPDADVEFLIQQGADDDEWLTGMWHVLDELGRVVAVAEWGAVGEPSPDYETNGHLLWPMIMVLPSWRRRGIATRLLAELHATMVELDRRVMTCWIRHPTGQAFAPRFGFEIKQVMPIYELRLDAIDWHRMDRWLNALTSRAPGYTAELIADQLPPALFEEYCVEKTALTRHMPRDDQDMGDWTYRVADLEEQIQAMDQAGTQHHNVIVRSPEGRIIAITDTTWTPSRPALAQQRFTGVHPNHRGRGLGKHIKARMLRHLVDRHGPDGIQAVRTDTSTTNAPMRAINERMGFEERERPVIVEAKRETVGAALRS